jgi:RNA polymerase sigma-70 factor (ECF subfamily)
VDAGFPDVVATYGSQLYRFALRLTGSAEDAEEIAQDALVRAYRALCEYDAQRIHALRLRPWLYRITLNVVRNRARRRRVSTVPLDGDGPDSVHGERPDRSLDAAERREEMKALLAALPPHLRAPVILRYVEELSYHEIAEALEQPIGTVKSQVHRGIGMLRVMMEGEVAV